MAEGPDEKGQCRPYCVFFKCGNRALRAKSGTIRCLWINDDCTGTACSYAICIRGKMLMNNRCGLTVRRITIETERPKELELDTKLKRRLSKRIRDIDDLI